MHRTPHRSTKALLLLPAALLLVVSCTRRPGENVMATVNGVDVTVARFNDYYHPGIKDARPIDEEYRIIDEKLDELIGYLLIQQSGRSNGLHKTPDFRARQENWEKELLNRVVKQRDIVEQIDVSPGEVDSLLQRAGKERRIRHIVVLNRAAADVVQQELDSGSDWERVAIQYSRDAEVAIHRGELGWIRYGQPPFANYPALQDRLFSMAVGARSGPVQASGEFHFIEVLEERSTEMGTPEQARAWAATEVRAAKQRALEQGFANRMWARGGYRLDEDQFRWLVDRIKTAQQNDPANNPVPVLDPEDRRRVVVRSTDSPYTAQDLIDRLALLNPQARDSYITLDDWRNLIVTQWVIRDEVAAYARGRDYDEDPGFLSEMQTYIDGQLYVRELERARSTVTVPTDEQVRAYYDENQAAYDLPERRGLTEVLVGTRQEAEEILRRARAGEALEDLADEHTIREGFRQRRGRFIPIRRGEFDALGEAVFLTPRGELGPIVETPLGFSVFRVTNVLAPEKVRFERAKENIRANLHKQWLDAAEDSLLTALRERARIVKNGPLLQEYTRQVVQMANDLKERAEREMQDPVDRDEPGRGGGPGSVRP